MFIDTHCHLTDDYCAGDALDAVIARATASGVDTIICPTANPADIECAIRISETHNKIFTTIGIHPEYAGDINPDDYLTHDVLTHPRVLGVGEIGLDYHYGADNRATQIKLFEQQIELARRYNLPVAIHTRDADDDTAAILDGTVPGVMHCFTSSWELAHKMLDRGFYFSASGIITFKNADAVRETFARIPLNRIVIETDAPYCAPVPYRGQICEPYMVPRAADVIAELHGISVDELAPILRENTKQLYPKIIL